MTKLEKKRATDRRVLSHMMESSNHPNAFTLRQMTAMMLSGHALTEEYLCEVYSKIFGYLALGYPTLENLHSCIRSLRYCERFDGNGNFVEAWLSLESDGTTDRAPKGERYRLTRDEVENLWRLVYPYNKEGETK